MIGPGAPLRILLVEDDPATLSVLTRLLRRLGHEVIPADGVDAALAAADASPAPLDLLISDIGLPDGDGLGLIRALRDRTAIPAIALTGFGQDDDVVKCREAGFNAHLTKPIEFRTLNVMIRQVVGANGAAHEEDVASSPALGR